MIVIDFPALVSKIETEINETRIQLNGLFERNPYLTRLETGMSPEEMTLDPVFAFNRDAPPVAGLRAATLYVPCDAREIHYDRRILRTPAGLIISMPNEFIRRQNGETVRGLGIPGALKIEQYRAAGQPELIEDQRAQIIEAQLPLGPYLDGVGSPSTLEGQGADGDGSEPPSARRNNPYFGFGGALGGGWNRAGDTEGRGLFGMSAADEDTPGGSSGCACDANSGTPKSLFGIALILFAFLSRFWVLHRPNSIS